VTTPTLSLQHEEDHDVPETWSYERQHFLDAFCWCRPEPVVVERTEEGALRRVQLVHRKAEDHASEYGRLLAERDRLVSQGVDPDELLVPIPPMEAIA
jgi:hypothetical protein